MNGGAWSLLKRPAAAVRRSATDGQWAFDRLRTALWHMQSSLRSWRLRSLSPPAKPAAGGPIAAFDLRAYNPIGLPRAGGGEAAALGPVERLPPGVRAQRAVNRRSLRRLRRACRVEDVSAFHADAVARAGELARLAAAGAVVHLADGGEELRPLLGDDLHRLMTADAAGMDAAERELLGVALRRVALREHSSWARARRTPPPAAPGFPLVSILLATRRPEFLPWALAAAARQTYPRLELVLALHGAGFADVERQIAPLPFPAKVLRVAASEPLGAALNAAAEAAGGDLLTKMDDDDAYGADHIWDLAAAREYSGAELAGKWMEFVYLAASERTAYVPGGGGERYWTQAPAGGAMLLSRRALDRAGGWRNAPRGVDLALTEDVLRTGGRVYRTHGAGFMLVRHGAGHTWDAAGEGFEDYLTAKAESVWPGFQPARAGIAPPALPHPALPPAARSSAAEPFLEAGS